MRAVFALTLTFVAALLMSAPAESAQAAKGKGRYLWCYRSSDGLIDCSYDTLAQCKASRPLESSCYRSRRLRYGTPK
jgi:hypothetical protein